MGNRQSSRSRLSRPLATVEWSLILRFCPPRDLFRLAQCSRITLAAAAHPVTWREMSTLELSVLRGRSEEQWSCLWTLDRLCGSLRELTVQVRSHPDSIRPIRVSSLYFYDLLSVKWVFNLQWRHLLRYSRQGPQYQIEVWRRSVEHPWFSLTVRTDAFDTLLEIAVRLPGRSQIDLRWEGRYLHPCPSDHAALLSALQVCASVRMLEDTILERGSGGWTQHALWIFSSTVKAALQTDPAIPGLWELVNSFRYPAMVGSDCHNYLIPLDTNCGSDATRKETPSK